MAFAFAKTGSRCKLESRLFWRVCEGARALKKKREIEAKIKLIPIDDRIAREQAYAAKDEQRLIVWAAYACFSDILDTGAEYDMHLCDLAADCVSLWDRAINARIAGEDAALLIGEAIDEAVLADREKTAAMAERWAGEKRGEE